jgi:putative salt-induced outer membrane protein YdiY
MEIMNQRVWIGWWALVLSTFFFTGDAIADKILMNNGDRFKGTVNKVEGGVLMFTTDYAASIPLKTSGIKKIITDEPATIHLTSGKIIKGRILPAEPEQIKVQSPTRQAFALVYWHQIKSINPPPEKWGVSISFGGSRDSGNTDRLSASLSAEAKRKFSNNQVEFRMLSNYSEEDDKVTARNTYGAAKYSRFFTPKWFSYLGLELLTDTFRDLNLRTTIGPGVGYQIWEDDKKSLSLEGGFSYINEDRQSAPNDSYLTSRFAGTFSYQINSRLAFANHAVVFPSVEDFGQYTLRNEASLSTDLGKGWKLKLSNIVDQDNNPAPGVKQTDVHWILALGYDF